MIKKLALCILLLIFSAFDSFSAEVKISELPSASTITSDDLLVIVDTGTSTTQKINFETFAAQIVSDVVYGSGWDTDSTHAPSKNAVYDKINSLTYANVGAAATSHVHAGTDITSSTIDGDRLPAISTTKKGGVPATGTPSGKYLKDDGTWATSTGAGDVLAASTTQTWGGGAGITWTFNSSDGVDCQFVFDNGLFKSVCPVYVDSGGTSYRMLYVNGTGLTDDATVGTTGLRDITLTSGRDVYLTPTSPGQVRVGTSLVLPSANVSPTTTQGSFVHDSVVSGFTGGALRYYNGTAIKQLIDITSTTVESCTDGYVVAYNSGTGVWYCKADADTISTQATLHVDDILTALGIASGAINFGTFTGSTIADNVTAKAALQALETSLELKSPIASPTFTGSVILPSADAGPAATAGSLVHDNTVLNFTGGALRYYNGTATKQLVDMTSTTAEACTDAQVVAYNASTDLWYCKDDSGGGTGDVATDGIWDAAGDLVVATGTHTAVILPKGAANSSLRMKSDASTVEWTPSTEVTVKAYGAVGNGIADDLTAINNALASGAYTVVLSDATGYKVTGTIVVPANVRLKIGATTITSTALPVISLANGASVEGLGSAINQSKILTNLTNGPVIVAANIIAGTNNLVVKDLRIDNTDKANVGAIGIDFQAVALSIIDNVAIVNIAKGIRVGGNAICACYNVLRDNQIMGNATSIHLSTTAVQNTITGGTIQPGMTGTGILIDSTAPANYIIGVPVENALIGAQIKSSGNSVINPYYENTTTAIKIEAAYNSVLGGGVCGGVDVTSLSAADKELVYVKVLGSGGIHLYPSVITASKYYMSTSKSWSDGGGGFGIIFSHEPGSALSGYSPLTSSQIVLQSQSGYPLSVLGVGASGGIFKFGQDAATADNQTLKAANSTGASQNGAALILSGGDPGSGGTAGNVRVIGDLKSTLSGKGIVLTNAAGTVTKRVRLNDVGDGLIFEAE